MKNKSKGFLHSLRSVGMTVVMIGLSACMPQVDAPDFSLAAGQPTVLGVSPGSDDTVGKDEPVHLTFSVPIDTESLTVKSVAVVFYNGEELVEDLLEDVVDGEIDAWSGTLVASDGGLSVTYEPSESYPAGSTLAVVVTPKLMSAERVPFNQTPGETPTPFISAFAVEGVATVSEDASSDSGDDDGGEVEVPKVRPSWLVISEVTYDVTGADTNGDLFIELAGEKNTEISGYKVNFVNGSDGSIYDDFKLPEGAFIPDDGVYVVADAITNSPGATNVPNADYVVNFDPQNGPDAIQLVDDQGALVDAVGYGNPIVAFAENGLASYESSPADDVGSNMSLARVDTFDTDDNSLDFIQKEDPSPGVVELMHE